MPLEPADVIEVRRASAEICQGLGRLLLVFGRWLAIPVVGPPQKPQNVKTVFTPEKKMAVRATVSFDAAPTGPTPDLAVVRRTVTVKQNDALTVPETDLGLTDTSYVMHALTPGINLSTTITDYNAAGLSAFSTDNEIVPALVGPTPPASPGVKTSFTFEPDVPPPATASKPA